MIITGAKSIIGTRSKQQDAYRIESAKDGSWTIAIVCDGMGGMQGGEIASNMACDFIMAQMQKHIDDHQDHIEETIEEASRMVAELKTADGQPMKAGTTMSMVIIRDGLLSAYSVGDSKIYYFHADPGETACITNEHNYAFMADQNRFNNDFEYDPSVRGDALVSYLGAPKVMYVDKTMTPQQMAAGDRLLICSDGVYKLLSDDEIARILKDGIFPQGIADEVIKKSEENRTAGQDNTTAVVLENDALYKDLEDTISEDISTFVKKKDEKDKEE